MPIPTPNRGESHDDFIRRCMSNETMREDFRRDDQRLAVCERQWDARERRTIRITRRKEGG